MLGDGLTLLQARCFDYISATIRHDGYSPSLRQIAAALELKSVAQASGLVDRLVERGYITRIRFRAHGIALANRETTCPNCNHTFNSARAPRADALADVNHPLSNVSERNSIQAVSV